MDNEYWECAVDEIMSDNGFNLSSAQVFKIANEIKDAANVFGESQAPVYMQSNPVKVVEIEPKSACCDAEITSKNTGLLNGHYRVCARCDRTVNATF